MTEEVAINGAYLLSGERYAQVPFEFRRGLAGAQLNLSLNQAKANLFWLVEPRVDTEGLASVIDNPRADSIVEHLAIGSETDRKLRKLPLVFLAHWEQMIKQVTPAMVIGWPEDYIGLMIRRAHEAHKRLLGLRVEGNIRYVNFRR